MRDEDTFQTSGQPQDGGHSGPTTPTSPKLGPIARPERHAVNVPDSTLEKREDGMWGYRWRRPLSLSGVVPKAEIRKSLGTTSHLHAKQIQSEWDAELRVQIEAALNQPPAPEGEPTPATQQPRPRNAPKCLSEASERFVKRKLRLKEWKNPNHAENFENALRRAIKVLGDRPLDDYTEDDAAPLLEEFSRTGQEQTANRNIGFVSQLFTFAATQRWGVERDPFSYERYSGAIVSEQKEEGKGRPFTREQYPMVFNHVYLALTKDKPAKRWMPLLCLLNGIGPQEGGQLRSDNLKRVGGVWCIEVRRDEERGQRLKQPSRRRTIPVHPILQDMGFIAYVEGRQRETAGLLFPRVSHDKTGRYGGQESIWFNHRLRALGILDRQYSYYSGRHALYQSMVSTINGAVISAIMGHRFSRLDNNLGEMADTYATTEDMDVAHLLDALEATRPYFDERLGDLIEAFRKEREG